MTLCIPGMFIHTRMRSDTFTCTDTLVHTTAHQQMATYTHHRHKYNRPLSQGSNNNIIMIKGDGVTEEDILTKGKTIVRNKGKGKNVNRKYKRVDDLFSFSCSKNNLQLIRNCLQVPGGSKGGMHEKRWSEKRGIINGLLHEWLQEFHPCTPSLCPTVLEERKLEHYL